MENIKKKKIKLSLLAVWEIMHKLLLNHMQVGIFLYYAEMKSSGEQQKNLDLSTKEGNMISEAENSNVENKEIN